MPWYVTVATAMRPSAETRGTEPNGLLTEATPGWRCTVASTDPIAAWSAGVRNVAPDFAANTIDAVGSCCDGNRCSRRFVDSCELVPGTVKTSR